jgi:multiple sugar transport system permease protein
MDSDLAAVVPEGRANVTHARGRGDPWKPPDRPRDERDRDGKGGQARVREQPPRERPTAPPAATRATAEPDGNGTRLSLTDREGFLAWALLLPSVVYIIALVGVPFLLAIAFAFSDVTTGDPSYDFVGTRNFTAIFGDSVFWRSLTNTLIFTAISMVLIVVFGKILANILVANFRGKWLVRMLVLLPWTTPVALSTISWLWMLDSIYSPIDWVLRQTGAIQTNMYWLGRPTLAMGSVIAVHVWRLTPLAAVIVMAGLVAIPKDIDEAARIDGAGFWRRMFEVTIPLTLPVIAVAALFGAIVTFTDMTVVYVLTRGGPTNSTQVLASWAYFRGIEGGDVGQGAAIALFLFPILLAGAIAILRAVRRLETQ